jgi:hypothetical protein
MAKLAAIERTASNCTDGCQTSFKHGNQAWNGCSWDGSGGPSITCRNAHNFKTYSECVEHGLLLGWRSAENSWYCGSLHAAGKLPGEKVAAAQYDVANQRSGRR